jgi:hypothetical protein
VKPLKPRTTSDKWQVEREMFGDFCAAIIWLPFLALALFSFVCFMPYFLRGPIGSLGGNYEEKSVASLVHISEVLDAILGTLIISAMIIGRYLSQLVKK